MLVAMTERMFFRFSAFLSILSFIGMPSMVLDYFKLSFLAKRSFYWFLPTITFQTHHKLHHRRRSQHRL